MKNRWLSFSLTWLCLLLQACTSSPSSPAKSITETSPTQLITIISPKDASAQMTTPVTIKVRVAPGPAAGAMRVLLDGVDITSRFTPTDGTGVRRAEVDRPLVNWGENQILVKSGSQQGNSHFFLVDHLDSSSAVANLPLLIPIKTRVVTGAGDKATDYNIALYKDRNDPTAATLIPAPAPQDGSNAGFQVVFLKRSDLSVVSNVSVDRLNPPSEDGQYFHSRIFTALLTPPLLAVQSAAFKSSRASKPLGLRHVMRRMLKNSRGIAKPSATNCTH